MWLLAKKSRVFPNTLSVFMKYHLSKNVENTEIFMHSYVWNSHYLHLNGLFCVFYSLVYFELPYYHKCLPPYKNFNLDKN